jgi:polysaccharide chain length determinant protein (PEP-CTERM system associated)
MTPDSMSLGELLQVMRKEGKRRLITLAAMFSITAIVALVIGLMLPKKYDASALILVEANNMIKPLLEGRTVPTSVADQTAIVTQIVTGKRILREVLQFGGWVKPPPAKQPDPREEEQLLKRLRDHVKIEATRDELVHIGFSDSDPARTYKVANKLAEIYVRESDAGKERESREAFEFIDKQVKEYSDKLSDIHEKVLAQYRGDAPRPTPTPESDGATSPNPQKPKIAPEELAQLRSEAAMLQVQVSRKPAANVPKSDPRALDQARSRVLQLQADLDRLRSTFTDEHPDVRRAKRDLASALDERDRLEKLDADRETSDQLASRLDDDVARAARARLAEVQRRIAEATNTPIRRSPSSLGRPVSAENVIDPEMRTVGRDTALSELLRRYEATRDVYQDLLKRRENARVTMELDAQQRGFNMRIQEPAEMPATASSLRLVHLALIGLFLALAVPIGFLVLLVRFDRRVRTPHQIQRLVPLLGSIGYSPSHREKSRLRTRELMALLMVIGVFVVYLAVFIIKLKTT